MLTKQAHITFHNRIHDGKVFIDADTSVKCGCFGSSKNNDPDAIPTELPVISLTILKVLKNMLHARGVSTLANDEQAMKDQVDDAKAIAQSHYTEHQFNSMW